MGHAVNGKASPTYQRACQGLAQLGYLVLGFDPMGQGERIYYPDASGRRSRVGSPDDEHTYPGKQLLLKGDTSTRLQLWDAVRSLDVLAAHPQVDRLRLASTGQSGGGTLTMFLMAVDDRLSAAVVCSGNTENVASAGFNSPGSTDDAEQNFPGSGPLGWDRWDTMYPFAPKPLLISVSDKDFFGTYSPKYVQNGWEEFQKLQRIYELLGKSEQIAWDGTALPHGLSYDTRLLVYNWLGRWLRADSKRVTEEPATTLETDETLWAASGSVVKSLKSDTPFTLNRRAPVAQSSVPLEQLLGIEKPSSRAKTLKRMPMRGVEVAAIEIESEPGVFLPAWLYTPRAGSLVKDCMVLVQSGSRLTNWHEDELFHRLALLGHAVVVPDIRGVGDLTPEFGRGAARHARSHADEEAYAWSSMILGRPLLTQRVIDILAATAAGSEYSANVMVAAQGRMTVPALMAGALGADIRKLYMAGLPVSFRAIAEGEQYQHSFANFLPGLLLHSDLPLIASRVAPRRVVLAGVVDAMGRAMPVTDVGQAYTNQGHVRVLPEARWDVDRLHEISVAS
jgi:dienelactone hydrolase